MSSSGSDAQRRFLSASDQPNRDDDSHNASLSTTPTQSHMQPPKSNPSSASKPAGSTLKPNTTLRPPLPHDTPAARTETAIFLLLLDQHRQAGQYIRRLELFHRWPRSNKCESFPQCGPSLESIADILYPCLVCTVAVLVAYAQTRPALGRQGSHNQRSVSYATSDIETLSAMSASEYSSGAEDDPDQWRRSQHRGRPIDTAIRQGTSVGRPGLLVVPLARPVARPQTSSDVPPPTPETRARLAGRAERTAATTTISTRPTMADTVPFDEEDDEVEHTRQRRRARSSSN